MPCGGLRLSPGRGWGRLSGTRGEAMRPAIPLFLLLAVLYLLTWGGHLYSPDEEILFRTTESLALRASLAIEPLGGFATRAGAKARGDGLEFAQYGVGQPLAAVPFYWLGRALQGVATEAAWGELRNRLRSDYPLAARADLVGSGALRSSREADSDIARAVATRLGVSLFNLAVTALSGAVLFALARRLCGQTRAAVQACSST